MQNTPMKLNVRAALQGIRYKAAWRMCKARTLPVHADQKGDLDRPLSRLSEYAAANKRIDCRCGRCFRPEGARQGTMGQESGAKSARCHS
ncbi:hypothetical protein Pnap_1320 [Polaromonas naphthalenivorans CJ2]|uniref:Uncharacterized protein n=1 Tax=Polaromonas naphthalenivorans (strain CJ2) TaxID=365044 RepID=A1VLV7_POLNA|nr:hypothetical protein Pnap_1320 [Polaromonas naphthalenivorans CJ2]